MDNHNKRGFGKGVILGFVIAVVLCLIIFVGVGGLMIDQLTKTTVAVMVPEDGKPQKEVLEYDTILDVNTVQKLNYIAAAIQSMYYEEVSREELIHGLYQGLFSELDIYSEYYTKEEFQDIYSMDVVGSYCGIGATLSQDMNTMIVEVVNVQKDSPAEEAGVKKGDLLLRADEYESTSMELSEFVTHVKGEEGTHVMIEVYRESTDEYLEFDIVRRPLDIITVESEMLSEETGYIQITEFSGKTTEQFETALDNLLGQGTENLIVDLRGNPGGNVTTVVSILDRIIDEGMIVYTEDKYGNRQEYRATDDQSLDLPLVVLIDQNSASASEIFAGAIKDHELGTLVGTTTYGKGIVQGLQELADGSALKMTTSTYYTPSGTCIHGVGVEPDVEVEYEFLGEDSDEYVYSLDNQIQKALELLEQ